MQNMVFKPIQCCVRDQDDTTEPVRHGQSLNWSQFVVQWSLVHMWKVLFLVPNDNNWRQKTCNCNCYSEQALILYIIWQAQF